MRKKRIEEYIEEETNTGYLEEEEYSGEQMMMGEFEDIEEESQF